MTFIKLPSVSINKGLNKGDGPSTLHTACRSPTCNLLTVTSLRSFGCSAALRKLGMSKGSTFAVSVCQMKSKIEEICLNGDFRSQEKEKFAFLLSVSSIHKMAKGLKPEQLQDYKEQFACKFMLC